jgi:arginase family enzyme
LVYKNSLEIFRTKPKVVFLGGDHSISYSTAKAFLDNCKESKKEPCLIIFDAHADCIRPAKEPSNRQWLRKLTEDGFPPQNILLVGTRNYLADEMVFLRSNRIKIIAMNQLLEDLQDSCDIIMEFSNRKELYVSIDADIVDPVFAPGLSYPESGGLTSRQLVYLIQRINKIRNLKSVDITEINPDRDKENLAVKFGAKILSDLL